MVDWEDIHPDFTDELQKEWEKRGFDYYDCKGYIDKNLEPNEADFADYLYYQGYYFCGSDSLMTGWTYEKIAKKIKELREEYNLWKALGITSELAFQWQNSNFTYQQIKEWIKLGLQPNNYEFAAYLRNKGCSLQQTLSLNQLRKEFNVWRKNLLAQEYLDCCYPKAKRKSIKILDIKEKNLIGSLDLSDFVNLEILDCWGNKLTDLKLANCWQLRILNCNNNQLISLNLTGLSKLEGLRCSNNYLKDLVFSLSQTEQLTYLHAENNNFLPQDCSIFENNTNLKELKVGNYDQRKIQQGIYNRFVGSLVPLQKLNKLEYLDISNTDLDSGLEYLPESVEKFYCSANLRDNAKCRSLEEEWQYFNHDLKKYKEFVNSPAQQWLDQNYPENNVCQRETDSKGWDGSYGWNNRGKKRAEIKKLDISKQNLVGRIRLKDFTNLEHLNCSINQLIDLDLRDCKPLLTLKCSKNNFENLSFLLYLTNLKKLDISDCPTLKGSLRTLEKLNKLERINVSHTNVAEGLEDLPESCQEIVCVLDYKYGSVEIAKQLSKFSEGEGKYSLNKWRIDKQNSITASTVPLERLFVIRSNLKQFFNKWGKEDSDDKVIELIKLQSPEQYSRYRHFGGVKWIARATAAVGGILALTNNATIGGALAATSPFVDTIASHIEDNYYTASEEKWKEFLDDTDDFLDNYHELLGIIKKIGSGSDLGKVNQALKNLNEKAEEFLKIYDEDCNNEIDVSELIEKRVELAQDLVKDKKESRSWAIVEAIKQLEDKVVDYQKIGSLIEEIKETNQQLEDEKLLINEEQQLKKQVENEENSLQDISHSQSQQNLLSRHEIIEMQNFEQQVQIVQSTYPSSNKNN